MQVNSTIAWTILYNRNVWQGVGEGKFGNFQNPQQFPKLNPYKLVVTVNNLLADKKSLSICFCQILSPSNSPTIQYCGHCSVAKCSYNNKECMCDLKF